MVIFNVKYFQNEIKKKIVKRVCKKLGLDDFIICGKSSVNISATSVSPNAHNDIDIIDPIHNVSNNQCHISVTQCS